MTRTLRNERGIALVLVLLIAIAVTALAMGGILLASTGSLTSKFHYKELALQGSADGGAELARDSLNRNSTILPDSGFVTLQSSGTVLDANGQVIPGFTRSVYAGRTGGRTGGAATSGQYGSNYASALSVIQDTRGAVAVRRYLLAEESWSRFAYAMNRWSNSSVTFACGEIAAGPVHSNQSIYISCGGSPKTLFMGPVTTVGTISGKTGANFMAGWAEGVQPVKWPVASDLARLRTYAQDAGANYDINAGPSAVNSFAPTTRIEFVTVDLNGNGLIDSNEGFFKVFRTDSATTEKREYVTAKRWPTLPTGVGALTPSITLATDPNLISKNCGNVGPIGGVTKFRTAYEVYYHPALADSNTAAGRAARADSVQRLLTRAGHRCYLGGDPRLFGMGPNVLGDTLTPDSVATYSNLGVGMRGKWLLRDPGLTVPAQLAIIRPGDQQYFIPLQSNVNFKGVIYVTGPVAISGRLRGRVTVAATGTISLADDLLYTTTPGVDCTETGDVLGVTTPEVVPIADNNVNNPFQVGPVPANIPVGAAAWAGGPVGLFDDSPDSENFHMFIFTLKQFYGENVWSNPGTYNPGAGLAGERCPANTTAKSGCVRVSGGIIQDDVGAPTFSGSSGWAEQHTYDKCGTASPPPYFPTTGRYLQNRVYEIDPVWLNKIGIAAFFRELQSR
jgi:hypothetical protein